MSKFDSIASQFDPEVVNAPKSEVATFDKMVSDVREFLGEATPATAAPATGVAPAAQGAAAAPTTATAGTTTPGTNPPAAPAKPDPNAAVVNQLALDSKAVEKYAKDPKLLSNPAAQTEYVKALTAMAKNNPAMANIYNSTINFVNGLKAAMTPKGMPAQPGAQTTAQPK